MKYLLYSLLVLFPFCVFAQPAITISTASDTVCSGSFATFAATTSGVSLPHYQWRVNNHATGSDSGYYRSNTLSSSDTISCVLTDSLGSTLAISNILIITVMPLPSAGVIHCVDTICYGTSATITDAVPSGKWGSILNALTVSGGLITGSSLPTDDCGRPVPIGDTVFYVVTNSFCSDTAFKPVFIETIPNTYFELPNSIGPANAFCAGTEVLPNNGFCMPDGIIYATNNNAFVKGWVHFAHPGLDTLICTASNLCGSRTTHTSISIVAPPYPTSISVFDQHVCYDSSMILLTDTAARNFMNTWSATSGSLKTIHADGDSTWLIAKEKGLDTIYLRSSNMCGSTVTSTIVTVNLPARINALQPVCAGRTIQFTDASSGGTWSVNNRALAVIDPIYGLLTTSDTGKELIIYTMPDGCYITLTASIDPLPALGSFQSTLCIGEGMLLNRGNGTWSVLPNDIASISYYGNFLNSKKEGIATAFLTAPNGCYDSVTIFIEHCDGGGAVIPSSFSGYVYPDPSAGDITIVADTSVYDGYTIVNSIGQLSMKGVLDNARTDINTTLIPPGIYFITLFGKQEKVIKFLKK